jgi:hypothetical protein
VIVKGRSGKRSSTRRSKRRRTTERVPNNGTMDRGASGSVKRRWRLLLLLLPGSTAPSAASLGASESSDGIGVEIEPRCASLRRNVGRVEKRLVGERVGEFGKRRRMRGRSGGKRRRRSRSLLGLQTQGDETLSPTCRIFLCHHRPCTRVIQTQQQKRQEFAHQQASKHPIPGISIFWWLG